MEPMVLHGHDGWVVTVAFNPNGKTLASGSSDNTVRLWIRDTETLANMVCKKVWRNLTMEEWNQFVGPDIPYERTCPNLPVHPSVLRAGQNLAKEGDIEGAIAIFQQVLELETEDEEMKLQLQSWIEALRAGKNPFTSEVLERLQGE
jgi:WD40 repeat protein